MIRRLCQSVLLVVLLCEAGLAQAQKRIEVDQSEARRTGLPLRTGSEALT